MLQFVILKARLIIFDDIFAYAVFKLGVTDSSELFVS